MEPTVLIALITAVGGILAAVVVAYSNIRKATQRDIEEFKKETSDDIHEIKELLAVTGLKVDTLWQIYAEEAIRDAKTSGIVASRSRVRPTKKFTNIIGDDLERTLNAEAETLSCVLASAYDVAVELWVKHKAALVNSSLDAHVPLKETWGALVVICDNAMHAFNGGN